jgi:hypothetical protein
MYVSQIKVALKRNNPNKDEIVGTKKWNEDCFNSNHLGQKIRTSTKSFVVVVVVVDVVVAVAVVTPPKKLGKYNGLESLVNIFLSNYCRYLWLGLLIESTCRSRNILDFIPFVPSANIHRSPVLKSKFKLFVKHCCY